ncbi:MAG: phytanoyl-CoA dioxygenase family protein [Pseudomonadales bacterium]
MNEDSRQAAAQSAVPGPEVARTFRADGVVCLRGALCAQTLRLAREAFDWSLEHPGPGASRLPSKGSGEFYQDLANPAALAAYDRLVRDTEVGDIIAALWGEPDVWFMYEQVFRKEGGDTRRTPWHQDAPYLPVRGAALAVMWISFDSVPPEQALEFVRGSHLGPLFDGSRFDPEDDTAPIYGEGSFPRLPDIEADRASWPIVSWGTEPGDVVVFHPAILHGGGATTAAGRRRTLSLRFFGEDAVVAWRPGMQPVESRADRVDATVHPLTRMRFRPDGAPFRDPAFPKIRSAIRSD